MSNMTTAPALPQIHVMTERELAEYLNLSCYAVRRMRLCNKLPYFKIDKRVLYCVEDVVEHIHQEGMRHIKMQELSSMPIPKDPYCLE